MTVLALTVVWFVVGKSISTDAVGTLFSALTLMLYHVAQRRPRPGLADRWILAPAIPDPQGHTT